MGKVAKIWQRFTKNKYVDVLKETGERFLHDDPLSHGAAIAFYTIFSLPAVLIIVTVLFGSLFGQDLIKDFIYSRVYEWIGPASAGEIRVLLDRLSRPGPSNLATVIGVATLLFSATTVFVSIKISLNAIWGVRPKPRKSYLKYALDRLLSFAMVLSLGFFMLVSIVFNTMMGLFRNLLVDTFSGYTIYLMNSLHFIVSVLVLIIIFAAIFKILPDARVRWRDVFYGAIFATVLFKIGEWLVSYYLAESKIVTSYGATGALVFILIWVYYSSVVLLVGAEFTHVWAMRHDRHILPKSDAVLIKFQEVTEEEELILIEEEEIDIQEQDALDEEMEESLSWFPDDPEPQKQDNLSPAEGVNEA